MDKKGEQLKEELRLAFRDVLIGLADDIMEVDLRKLKALMKGKPGYGMAVLERITTVWEFFDLLENNRDLSPDNTDYLNGLLGRINRDDLCAKMDKFKETDHDLPTIQRELRYWYREKLSKSKPTPWCNCFAMETDHVFTKLEILPGRKHQLSKRGENKLSTHIHEEQSSAARSSTTRVDPELLETVEQLTKKLWRPEKRTVTFIEGAPGIGKTTLSRRLAYTWAQSNNEIHGFNFEIVILLEVRFMKGDLKESIFHLFPESFIFDKNDIYSCIEKLENHCLIILDGVDETNEKSKAKVKKLLYGSTLSKAQLVLTGRSGVAHKYVQKCDYHLRISGFSKDNSICFIERYFAPNQKELMDKLLQNIETKVLKDRFVNPFYTLLLCILAEENSGQMPKKQVDILKEITLTVCRRYISTYDEGTPPSKDELMSAARLLAYHGQKSKKLVFENSFVREMFPERLSEHLLSSGLLSRDVATSQIHGTNYCFFPHKIFQECLCADYLATFSEETLCQCLESVMQKSDEFMISSLLNLLSKKPGKFELVVAHAIGNETWNEIMPDLLHVDSRNLVYKLANRRYCIFKDIVKEYGNGRYEVDGEDDDDDEGDDYDDDSDESDDYDDDEDDDDGGDGGGGKSDDGHDHDHEDNCYSLVHFLVKIKIVLPPFCLSYELSLGDDFDSDPKKDELHLDLDRIYAAFPENEYTWKDPQVDYESLISNKVTLPIVNCYSYFPALQILKSPLDIGILNICINVLCIEDIAEFILLLKQVTRPMTVFVVLVCRSKNDDCLLRMLHQLSIARFKNISLHVHVHVHDWFPRLWKKLHLPDDHWLYCLLDDDNWFFKKTFKYMFNSDDDGGDDDDEDDDDDDDEDDDDDDDEDDDDDDSDDDDDDDDDDQSLNKSSNEDEDEAVKVKISTTLHRMYFEKYCPY